MQNINYSTLKEKDSNKTTKVRDSPPRDKQKKPRGFDPASPTSLQYHRHARA